MVRARLLIAAVILAVPALSFAQDAKSVIDAASKAIGVDALRTVEYSGSGFDFVYGQAYSPTSPWPKFADKTYTRQINFQTPASRMDRVRMQAENPPRGGGQQPVRGEQMQNQTIVVSPSTPWVQQLEIWMMPHAFLRAAAMNNATLKSQRVGGKAYRVLTFTGQNKAAVNGYVNEQNLVERVETMIDNPLFGDTAFESVYSDYKDFNGVQFPMHIVQRQGGYPVLDLTVSDVKPNAPVNIQPPANAGGGAPAAQATPSEKLGDGVYLILGGYASLAIEMKDHIVVVEAPQSEERAVAVMAEAKRLIPNKPIRYVINTHHHVDHSGGIRAAMAEGATIVTHEVNKPFFEKIAAAPHTLSPDRLSAARKKPVIETVTEKKVLTDGNQVIELHHLAGNGHNAGLLVVYLPRIKTLLEADAYNPPAQANTPPPTPVSPYTANMVSAIDKLKLDVETIIPVHYAADGRKITRAELMRVATAGTN
jgi:glyoxylase-like metal-dependent hydrolase (beta-lactamase superfamily II)